MKETVGELWDLAQPGDALVITTNGDVNKDGLAVMGRGIALEAVLRYPGIRRRVGELLQQYGNHAYPVWAGTWFPDEPGPILVTMPVKHHWHEEADLQLIVRSAFELLDYADKNKWPRIWMPRPGCGNGRLDWAVVKRPLGNVLDDRFIAVTKE